MTFAIAFDPAAGALTLDRINAWAAMALAAQALLLVAAMVTDLHQRRIPNRLIAAGTASAVLQQGLLPHGLHPAVAPAFGTPGLWAGGLAAGLMLLIAAALWRAGLWGAGDAKWLTVLAAHAGPAQVLPLLLFTLMAGGLLAVCWKLARQPSPMPYALAIAAGHLALVASLLKAPPDAVVSTVHI